MDFLKRNKKFLFKALLIVFVLVPVLYFGVNIQHANAQFWDISGFAIKSVLNLVTFLLGIIQWIVGVVLIKLSALLVGFVLLINQTLLKDLNNDHFVVIGWRVFRDLANLGFVLGIIIIAISTILRFKTYAYQNLLPKLIIAALVINFSLVIAGSIISVSDIFSNFFINYISGRGSDSSAISAVSQQIVDRFNYVKLAVPGSGFKNQCVKYKDGKSADQIKTVCEATQRAMGGLPGSGTIESCILENTDKYCQKWSAQAVDSSDIPDKEFYAKIQEDNLANNLYQIGGVFVSVVVGFFIFLSLLALAGGLFLRYFYLAFLLIVSPLVWVLWVFPYTRGHWKKWWESFIKWVFFAPVILFFLYLTLIFLSKSSGGYGSYESKADEIALTSDTSIAGVGLSNIMVPLMAGALLFAGLKISQTMGFAGASFVLNRADATGKWARTKALRGAQRGGALAMRSKPGQWVKRPLATFGATKVGRFLGAGKAAQGLEAATVKLERKSQAYLEDKKKSFGTMSSENIVGLWKTMTGEEQAAAMEVLASRNDLGDLKDQNMTTIGGSLAAMRRFGREKEAKELERRLGMNQTMAERLKILNTSTRGSAEYTQALAEYRRAAADHYGKYSTDHWRDFGSNLGNNVFSGRTFGGLRDDVYQEMLGQAAQYASDDYRRSIHAVAPRMKTNTNLSNFNRTTIERKIGWLREHISGLDLSIPANQELLGQFNSYAAEFDNAVKNKNSNFSDLAEMMGKCEDAGIRDFANHIRGQISAFAMGAYSAPPPTPGVTPTPTPTPPPPTGKGP